MTSRPRVPSPGRVLASYRLILTQLIAVAAVLVIVATLLASISPIPRSESPLLQSAAAQNQGLVGAASTPDGRGYWAVGRDGGVFSYGSARFFGSMGGQPLNKPIVGMASAPDGNGYWLVASDGGIFSYGSARFFGSMGGQPLNKPIVGMAGRANGYWMVASDGGIFSYGEASFYGSTGSIVLNKPVVGMASVRDGSGYWLVASDGGIFSFGNAPFWGSGVGGVGREAIGIVAAADNKYGVIDESGRYVTPREDGNPSRDWTLEFFDDFNGDILNPNYWSVYNSRGNAGVGWRRPSAIEVGGGNLRIVGRGDVSGGLCFCGSSAYDQVYGRWEIRARMDAGNGYGPAILLWPENNEDWPEAGEIDISEIPKGDRKKSYFVVHYDKENKTVGSSSVGDFTQWHTFGVEWGPTHITYFLDGYAQYTVTLPEAIPHGPMHLAIQNDIGDGSNWISPPDANTPDAVALHVDWVKTYRW